eukprot:gene15912-17512_t
MDEENMETSIAEYKEQLAQIEIIISSCTEEENKNELSHLKNDVLDLIKVTEESLLSLKKSRLLQELSSTTDAKVTNTTSKIKHSNQEPEDNTHEFLGIKCRVRHTFDWGVTGFHNAMVVGTEEIVDGKQKIKVLFTNPTHKSMVPCSYFLDGKCRFSEDNCRFSHGYLADVSDVDEYVEPDFSNLNIGGQCLAKYDDGIWYKATVRKIHDDTIEVHYDTYDMDAVLDLHLVLPLETRYEESDSMSSCDSDTIDNDENSRDLHEDNYVAELSRKAIESVGPLGEWEEHTKGIGSKLMAKMGYEFGKGLGREGEGRVEPIEIVILPAGKSLDKIAELRESGRLHKPLKKKRIKQVLTTAESSSNIRGAANAEGFDVFAFINKKLTKKDDPSTVESELEGNRLRHNIEDSYRQLKTNRLQKKRGESTRREDSQGTNWNVKLFKNNEKALSLRRRLSKQRDSLKRNLGRDQEMVKKLQDSISSLELELSEIENSCKNIENKINSKAQHKKLTIF